METYLTLVEYSWYHNILLQRLSLKFQEVQTSILDSGHCIPDKDSCFQAQTWVEVKTLFLLSFYEAFLVETFNKFIYLKQNSYIFIVVRSRSARLERTRLLRCLHAARDRKQTCVCRHNLCAAFVLDKITSKNHIAIAELLTLRNHSMLCMCCLRVFKTWFSKSFLATGLITA